MIIFTKHSTLGSVDKKLVTFSRFWLRGWGRGVWVNLLKRKIWDKNLFSDNVEWSSKNLWKMMSADVKANIKQQEIKDVVAVSYNLILVSIPSILILSVKNKGLGGGGGGGLLNRQNLLSMTKVICWQSLRCLTCFWIYLWTT